MSAHGFAIVALVLAPVIDLSGPARSSALRVAEPPSHADAPLGGGCVSPTITEQPPDRAVNSGGTIILNVVAEGTAPLAYRWWHDGRLLVDGYTDWGSRIAGSATPELRVYGASCYDIGDYGCIVTNPCGAAVSEIATVAVGPCRRGDLNCDGLVNNFDIDPFVLVISDAAAYRALFPNCEPLNADINADGQVNNFDIDPFVALIARGG